MGNEPLCGKDTRDLRNSTYLVCGKEPQFRNSASIHIVNYVPVVSGPPLNFEKQQTFKKVQRSAAQFCQKNGLQPMYIPLVARIIAYGHTNLFAAYLTLSQNSRAQFLEDIRFADIDFLDSLNHRFILKQRQPKKAVAPPNRIAQKQSIKKSDRLRYLESGAKLLANGQVAFVFLCAGCSSRFLFQDKFIYPLELNPSTTVIQLMLTRLRRNLRATEGQVVSVPIVFAVSDTNRQQTQNFIRSKDNFGFDPSRIRYLSIPSLPVLNQKGKLCLSFESKIISRPSGTLKCIEQLIGSGLFNWLRNSQITTLHISGAENLMQDPGDPFILGFAKENKLDIVGKCTQTLFAAQQFSRYALSNDQKSILINPEEILESKISQKKVQQLMENCPIAMNSIVCGLNQLKAMTKDYNNSLFLSLSYIALKKTENAYDFEKNKPLVNSPIFVFEKQIGHLFTCTKKHAFLKVPRDDFLPIITKGGNYSMREACKKLIQRQAQLKNSSKDSTVSFQK